MQRSLTSYHIKLLAATFMVIDHVGAIFLPHEYGFRAIGRLSFPLFCWLLVQGEAHTKNIWQYALRLLMLGIISQPIYMLAFEARQLNILFTLLLGLLALRAARIFPDSQFVTWIGIGLLAEVAHFEYGAYGIAIIGLIRHFNPNMLWWACWITLHVALLAQPSFGNFQFPAVFTPLIIQYASQQRGPKARWFYLFYPLHLLVLFLINQ